MESGHTFLCFFKNPSLSKFSKYMGDYLISYMCLRGVRGVLQGCYRVFIEVSKGVTGVIQGV